MHTETGDLGAYVDAAAALIGLSLDPAHRPGVILNMQRIAEMAALVMEFPLPDDVRAGPGVPAVTVLDPARQELWRSPRRCAAARSRRPPLPRRRWRGSPTA